MLLKRQLPEAFLPACSIRQHTSAYVSIRQHTAAHVSTRQHTCPPASALRVGRRGHFTQLIGLASELKHIGLVFSQDRANKRFS
jgi:hypothetical protein